MPAKSRVEYSYAKRGHQKQIRQGRRRSRRINIFGVCQPGIRFSYALMLGTLKAKTDYVQLMNWQALLSQAHWLATRQITVIVQGKASIHSRQLAQ
ncbi:MAG TPA: hypothetical protein DEV81_01085 [Cyanobacteria bacterium UBA11049]|nr:hypothetical protein [Cyanobacteria bacterium UBA11049]